MSSSEEANNWGVWCTVSGGVTGSRAAWLKESGKLFTGTKAEARAKADEIMASLEGMPTNGATFGYYPKERTG